MNLLVIPSPTFGVTPARLMRIQDMARGLTVAYTPNPTAAQIEESEIILGCPPVELLCRAVKLRWLHITNSGVEPYGDLGLYARRDTVLTNARGVYGVQISEHAVGLMLALSRLFPHYALRTAERVWQRRNDVRELAGARVCIFGTGDIGASIAKRLSAFDCHIVGVRRNILERPACFHELYPPHRRLDALAGASYAVSCLPRTSLTTGIFDKAAFDAMAPGSVFVNVGRGSAVVQEDLAEALSSGRLMGAGLDVTEPEPLPPESPLWDCENMLITAHGSAASPYVDERNFELFMSQLSLWNAGKRLKNTVDFISGY